MHTSDCSGLRQALVAAMALAGLGVGHAQTLPEAFDPGLSTVAESTGPEWLLAPTPGPTQLLSAGTSSVSLGHGARASFVPLGWARRETLESGRLWVLQAQTDGYKRVTSSQAERSGLSDLTVSSVWEQSLGGRTKGRATIGSIIPSHGEVGGKKLAMFLGGGLVQALTSNTSTGAGLLVVMNTQAAIPGASRTLWRADANLGVVWTPSFRTSLSGAYSYQESAPRLQELALLGTLAPGPGTELRLRVWRQEVERAPRRLGLGIVLALAR